MLRRNRAVLAASMSRIYNHIYSGAPVAMISADRYTNSRKVKEQWRRELRVDINRRGFSYIISKMIKIAESKKFNLHIF